MAPEEVTMDDSCENNTSKRFAGAYERLYRWGTAGGIIDASDRYGLDTLVFLQCSPITQ